MFTNFPNGITSFSIPIMGNSSYPMYTGNTYIVGNSLYDTNYNYLHKKFGTRYKDGSNMFHSTLQSAIDVCVDWRGDRIIVGPRTFTVTTPVLFNKKGIHVESAFNISGEDNGERFTQNADTALVTCATISEPCTIVGLGFDSGSAAGAALTLGPGSGFDGGNFVSLLGCRFTNWGNAAYAIKSSYNDYLKVLNCSFDGLVNGDTGANVFDAGVHLIQGHYVTVDGCTFRGCTYAIQHGTPNPANAAHSNKGFVYKGNRLIVSTTGGEKLIDFNTIATYTETLGMVCDNYTGLSSATSYSNTVATIQASAAKCLFAGNHYAE